MKNLVMHFALVLILVLTMITESYAQSFRLKTGLNLSNMLMKDDANNYNDDSKNKLGFHIGATAEFPLSEILSFETGLLLSTKGFKLNRKGYVGKLNLDYLDIPITGKASFDIKGVKFYGVFGPYLGMGLSGKSNFENTFEGETKIEEEVINWGSDKEESDFKRLDFGITIGGGIEIKSIQIGLSYNLGLANISPDSDDGFRMKNRVLGLSVGYKFGEK